MYTAVFVLFCLGLGRAAMFRFQEKEDAIRKACRDQLAKLGLTYSAAKEKYFTPEIHMITGGRMAPGGSAEVSIKGKFAPGTQFVFENDNFGVVKEALAGNEYRATVKAAPGIGPMNASVVAISPVTGLTTRQDNALSVCGAFEWTIQASNGWKVVARPDAGAKTCAAEPGRFAGAGPYSVAFYRPGESAPFESRSAKLYYSMYERQNYRFAIEAKDETEAGDFQSLAQKLSDPKLTDAERQAVMKKVQEAQARLMANAKKMMDPAYIKAQEARKLEFGCERIYIEAQAASFKGELRCSEKVGRAIPLTGTMRPL